MKINHYLIITLGTRDIALSKNTPNELFSLVKTREQNNSIYPVAPRLAGKVILEHIQQFLPYIHLPIIEPLLHHYFIQKIRIPLQSIQYLFIATNQPKPSDIDKEFYFNSDTVYYPNIIQHYLHYKYNIPLHNIQQHLISHPHLNLYDQMYEYFHEQFAKEFTPEPPFQIFFLPQGGIDAINTTLMLYLNENYSSIQQLYINENAEYTVLKFPIKYKLKLIEKLIDNYNYSALLQLPYIHPNLKQFLQQTIDHIHTKAQPENKPYISSFNKLKPIQWQIIKLYLLHINQDISSFIISIIAILETQINNIHQYFKIPHQKTTVNKNKLSHILRYIIQQHPADKELQQKEQQLKSKKIVIRKKIQTLQFILQKYPQYYNNPEQMKQFLSILTYIEEKFYNRRNYLVHHNFTIKLSSYEIKSIQQDIQQALNQLCQYFQLSPQQVLHQINQTIKQEILNNI